MTATAAFCTCERKGAACGRGDELLKPRLKPRPGFVTIAGYGSLMDEASARATTPSLFNWRLGVIQGYGRVFDLISIIRVQKGQARGDYLTTCTARPMHGCSLHVCLYDIPFRELEQLTTRERRLNSEEVTAVQDSDGLACSCVLFTRYSDERYRRERATTDEKWHEEVGQFYAGEKIYVEDRLPVPAYLAECLSAYRRIADEDNFLDNSFLGDARTSIRAYIRDHGEANTLALPKGTLSEALPVGRIHRGYRRSSHVARDYDLATQRPPDHWCIIS